MNVRKARLLVAAVALACPLAASAQFYAAAAVGAVNNKVECHDRLTLCDQSDTGYKLLGGYRFTPLFAGEVSYFDYGKGKLGDADFTQELAVAGIGVGAALHGDFTESLSWVVRAGLGRVKVTMDVVALGFLHGTGKDTHVAPYYGVGASWRFAKPWSLDLSWDMTEAVFDKNNGNLKEWDVSAFWLGVTYTFGR